MFGIEPMGWDGMGWRWFEKLPCLQHRKNERMNTNGRCSMFDEGGRDMNDL